jgi:hypothetical protein
VSFLKKHLSILCLFLLLNVNVFAGGFSDWVLDRVRLGLLGKSAEVSCPENGVPICIGAKDGGKISGYVLRNNSDRISGPLCGRTIVWFSGNGCSATNIFNYKSLVDDFFYLGASEIVALDVRGYGRSVFKGCVPGNSQSSNMNEQTIIEDIESMVNFLIIRVNKVSPPPLVIGHSLGGFLASCFARKCYEKIRVRCSVVLLSPLLNLQTAVEGFCTSRPGGGMLKICFLRFVRNNDEFNTCENIILGNPKPLIVITGDKSSDWLSSEGTEIETICTRLDGVFICIKGCGHTDVHEMFQMLFNYPPDLHERFQALFNYPPVFCRR